MSNDVILCEEEQSRLRLALRGSLYPHAAELREVWEGINRRRFDNGMYRFYSGSSRVFDLQETTGKIAEVLRRIAPEGRAFCDPFQQILDAGTDRESTLADHDHWLERVARYFLELALKCEGGWRTAPWQAPIGWAALLSLYGLSYRSVGDSGATIQKGSA